MDRDLWIPYWRNLVIKCEEQGYESLSENERIWYNIRVLIDSVGNGGIVSFYYNSGADNLTETLEDLSKLKANKISKILQQVNNLFPNGNPPANIDERNEIIDSGKNRIRTIMTYLKHLMTNFMILRKHWRIN